MSEQRTLLEIEADRAIFDGAVQTVVACIYQNERPLSGLAGKIDWYSRGMISNYLKKGWIQGKVGECVYVPWVRNGITYHFLLVGGGNVTVPGKRTALSTDCLSALQQNLLSLKPPKVCVSRTDLGISNDVMNKTFKGIPLWIAL